MSEAPPYSRRSLARLALSLKAAEVSERATDLVPSIGDEWVPAGTLIREAKMLLASAQETLQRAVTAERESGVSWTAIAQKLCLPEEEARARFGANSEAWVEAVESLLHPSNGCIHVALLPGDGPATPSEHAQRLDAWMAERDHDETGFDTQHQVSGGLEATALSEQLYRLAQVAQRVRQESDREQRYAYQEAEAVLLERVARTHPNDPRAAQRADEASLELLALKPAHAKA
jgi:hypothetical protein